nr:hypothetical protein [Tanacetum cinerariifolium]
MTSQAQQIALDNELVAPKNYRAIGRCNMRINPGMKPIEPTYQVELDALALMTCYPTFLITAEVPVQGKEFDEPPTEEEALSFIHELGHSREIRKNGTINLSVYMSGDESHVTQYAVIPSSVHERLVPP